jgi:hypothetical protein
MPMKWDFIAVGFSILVILAQSSASAAEADVGEIFDSEGKSLISRAGDGVLTVKDNIGIRMEDIIETGKGSLGILFNDETTVDVSEHSILVIDDFVYDPATTTGALAIKATLGTLRYVSGEIAKNAPENINISTPTASVAVRGTEFTATVDEIGRSTFVLLPSCDIAGLNCVVGAIEVSSDAGNVFMNQANQMTQVVSASLAPSSPVILNSSEIQLGSHLILGGPSLTSNRSRIEQIAKEKGAEGNNIFIDQLDVDLLDNDALLGEEGLGTSDFLSSELNENFLTDPLSELTELASVNAGSAATEQAEGSTTVTEGAVGVSVDQATETAVISINIDPSSTQTITIDNDSESSESIDVGGGGGAQISITQSQ